MADDLSEKLKKLKHNLVRLVEYQLAIEDYEDLSGDKTVYPSSKQATLVLNGIWRNEKVWDWDKRLDESEKALILFDKLTDEIGKENFAFHDDGKIEFCNDKTKNSKNQKEKENG